MIPNHLKNNKLLQLFDVALTSGILMKTHLHNNAVQLITTDILESYLVQHTPVITVFFFFFFTQPTLTLHAHTHILLTLL